jgi:predicted esterase
VNIIINTVLNTHKTGVFSWIFPPADPQKKQKNFLLLHGWTGNEASMSVFLNALPKNHFSVSPRGLFQITKESYGWLNINNYPSPDFSDFYQTVDTLMEKFKNLLKSLDIPTEDKWNVIGFSQGAALASVIAARYPNHFKKICLLSGFIPNNAPQIDSQLSNLEIFISHGLNDDKVPFKQALKSKEFFLSSGASVVFCQEEQNHKIGAACSVNLRKFLNS